MVSKSGFPPASIELKKSVSTMASAMMRQAVAISKTRGIVCSSCSAKANKIARNATPVSKADTVNRTGSRPVFQKGTPGAFMSKIPV